jgi:hypothetical protein
MYKIPNFFKSKTVFRFKFIGLAIVYSEINLINKTKLGIQSRIASHHYAAPQFNFLQI